MGKHDHVWHKSVGLDVYIGVRRIYSLSARAGCSRPGDELRGKHRTHTLNWGKTLLRERCIQPGSKLEAKYSNNIRLTYMPFNRQSASKAGRSSKRGKSVLTKEIKEVLGQNFIKILDTLKIEELTTTEKIKLLQLSINYIIPKALEKNVEIQQPIQSIVWMPASEK